MGFERHAVFTWQNMDMQVENGLPCSRAVKLHDGHAIGLHTILRRARNFLNG